MTRENFINILKNGLEDKPEHILNDIADDLDMLGVFDAMKWNKIEESQPDYGVHVLLHEYNHDYDTIGYRIKDGYVDADDMPVEATHWRAIPPVDASEFLDC